MTSCREVILLRTLSSHDGSILAQAIRETFRWRQTPLPRTPVAFTDAFAQDREKQAQWMAFMGRHRLEDAPATLHEAIQVIAAFLQPVIQALSEEQRFDQRWSAGDLWV